ncbi:P22 phage major capsid protein family protein [Longimicrobium sp.]|uniref:P22 phage major capsid protein family protein n=1 Tax=Longimicrobium sp. TaxID=2029185 RepID=UPI002E369D09|nr:P22 phage major capsid protein family protein [Longimicrobium sp.]HEX6038910.1 P22 phage major capsid protein family protein [Longimicrobium sp.]
MANTLVTPSWTLKEVGRGFENNLRFVNNIERKYSDEFVQAGAKVGNTINYRLPQRFTVSDGQALDIQNLLDQTVPISLTNQKHVDMSWSAWQETTEVEDVRRRYIDKAASALASVIDNLAFETVYKDVYNSVGTPGTTPSTNLTYLQAGRKLDDLATPTDKRVAVLDSEQMIVLVNANLSSFNPSAVISEGFRKGMFGRNVLNIDEWYSSQSRATFTTGSSTTSTPLVDGAGQTGSTININGWGSGATSLKKGDIITIAGVFSVNPENYQSTGRLQQFVITADTSDSSGATATLPISPSIITSGSLQTVSASPANDAVVTYWSMAAGGSQSATASPTGLIFHPEAFAGVTADLALPNGGAKATRISSKLRGIALRMAEQWDVQTDQNITRIDTIVGFATTRASFACRAQG